MPRNRLSVNRLDDFLEFLKNEVWEREPEKCQFEAARLRRGKSLILIHRRLSNHNGTPLTHLTMCRHAEVMFDIWIKERLK